MEFPSQSEFTLKEFRDQLEAINKPGLMKKLIGLMPGMGEIAGMMGDAEHEMDTRRLIGIINSMTTEERRNPKVIEPSRRNRIAIGSGTQPQEVHQLVKQYDFMAPMMRAMAGNSIREQLQALRDLRRTLKEPPQN